MAGSRIEKFGTIYSRLQGLLKSGALSEVDCPVWKSVYEAFPPQKEPMHERPIPEQKVRPILYPEDFVRVFVEKYFDLQEKGVKPEDLFDKTTEILKTENARLRSVDEHAEMISAQEASSKEDGEKL